MTEKKKLPEQVAAFRRPVSTRAVDVRRKPPERREIAYKEKRVEAPYTLQRVVTVPEADPSTAWNTFSQRQQEMRRERSRPRTYVKTAPRTFAQTGTWASNGRIKAIPRGRPAYSRSHVPVRSGRVARRRSLFWRLLGALFVGTLIVLAIGFALTGSPFRIAQVDVMGTHSAVLAHAIQSMGVQGQNVFLLDVSALREHIEAFPLVASADVSRQWPNQIEVSIVERTPVLLWQTTQGSYSIDGQGVVIAQANQTAGADHLPVLIDINNNGNGKMQSLQPGMHIDQAEITFARELSDRLPGAIGSNAFKLYYDGTIYASNKDEMGGADGKGSFIVESPDGWKAYLGNATDLNPLANRLLELQQILALARQQGLNLATIDLRYGLRPVYTLT
ncbi:MAG TPA: FtsQ-type POTRA domain-containing protein [Ktedonobacteraceae bacterium]